MDKPLRIAGLCALLLGCSGSNWVPQDLEEDEELQAVGAAGYQRLCSAFEGYIRDEYEASHVIQAVCLAHGIQTTTTASACGDAVNACTDNLPPSAEATLQEILAQASCNTLGVDPVGCAATVADAKACLDGLEDQLDEVKFSLVCTAAGETFDDAWWHIDLPPQCQALRTLCPE